MERVLVLGPCGAGKSWLARRLGPAWDLPIIHLDREYHRAGWQVPPDEEWHARVAELIARPRWIMEGNYGSSLEVRLERADTVILLDYPRRVFFPRMLRRTLVNLGGTRPDMADGCRERIDFAFWRYTWRYRLDNLPRHEELLARSGLPIIRFGHPSELDRWLAGLPGEQPT